MESIFRPTDILLPRCDPERWSCIACDQFTSEPEYWAEAEEIVGDAPSALRLILPEAWLDTPRAAAAAAEISATMERYLAEDVFETLGASFVYVERIQSDGRVRRGLVGAVDLEAYDYSPGSTSPVRATEDTVATRLPPRVAVRRAAALELPHVMMLMDDRDERVLLPLSAAKHRMRQIYDFDLMLGGGHLAGWQVCGALAETVCAALDSLSEAGLLREKYGEEKAPVVFAMGDGNHSLATAKLCWQQVREGLSPAEREKHPARFSLVELVNVYDAAIDFEPIHRVVFDTDAAAFRAEADAFWARAQGTDWPIGELIGEAEALCQRFISVHGGRLDYIHGDESARTLGERPGCGALILPAMKKDELFTSVVRAGAFPRKSFSIGHARDKRYYLEGRKIR